MFFYVSGNKSASEGFHVQPRVKTTRVEYENQKALPSNERYLIGPKITIDIYNSQSSICAA